MSRRKANPIRVAIREGEIVRLKRCAECSSEKRVTSDRRSEFPLNGRRNGRPAWKPICKQCYAQKAARAREANLEAERARKRATYARRIQSPEFRAEIRERARTYRARRRRESAAFREAELRRSREWRRRKRREDPAYFTPERRAERQRQRLQDASVIDGTRPRLPAEPFTSWLEAYKQAYEIPTLEELANHLQIGDRRTRSLLGREQNEVALDVVDQALVHAGPINGTPVWRLEDLYPESVILRATRSTNGGRR